MILPLMKKIKINIQNDFFHKPVRLPIALSVLALVLSIVSVPIARADKFDQQIQQLQSQNAQTQAQVDQLQAQASSYQDAINKLQAQIDALSAQIQANKQKIADLQTQIDQAQAELDKEKKVLGEDIRQMYLDGQISTLEMLASSKDLSDFVDKQEYRSSVQDKIKTTLDKITALKHQLRSEQESVQAALKDQQNMQDQLNVQNSQLQQLLGLNQEQQASYNQQIQSNQAQIASLRAQQLAANRALGGQVTFSGSCGGSYPASASGPYGNWGCNYAKDNTFDNWGMGNRECVSYTAWMVYKTYGYMPYWGGVGNANQWPGDARAANIPTGSVPKVGSVAISMGGAFGHAMWVDSVSGNMIHVQQYNYDLQGNYSEMWVNGSNFIYIYFGG